MVPSWVSKRSGRGSASRGRAGRACQAAHFRVPELTQQPTLLSGTGIPKPAASAPKGKAGGSSLPRGLLPRLSRTADTHIPHLEPEFGGPMTQGHGQGPVEPGLEPRTLQR